MKEIVHDYCIVCGEKFTTEELDTIDSGLLGLHGQHANLKVCRTNETDADIDCDCWEDEEPRLAHPLCCPSCAEEVRVLGLILDTLEDDSEGPAQYTIWQGPWSVS